MAIIRFVPTVKDGALAVIRTAIDAGSGPGTIKIYSSPQPTLATDAVTTQTHLGTLSFQDPCGTETGGVFTAALPMVSEDAALATATATWARIADSAGNTVCDVDVGTTGGGASLQMNTTAIVINGPIVINSFTISVP
jgi:hypothetical protein